MRPHLRFRFIRQQRRHKFAGGLFQRQFFRLMLGKIADFQLAGVPHGPRLQRQPSGNDLGQRRFAVTVCTQQGNAVIIDNLDIQTAQNRFVAIAGAAVFNCQQRRR